MDSPYTPHVAEVVESHPPPIGDAIINDGPGLLLIVEKQPWGNTLAVTRGVEEALRLMGPGLAGVEIDPAIFADIFDQDVQCAVSSDFEDIRGGRLAQADRGALGLVDDDSHRWLSGVWASGVNRAVMDITVWKKLPLPNSGSPTAWMSAIPEAICQSCL